MYDYASDIFNRLASTKQVSILNNIVEAFGHYGYSSISLRNMSELTGFSTGSLYQYFVNKEGMLNAATNYVFDRFSEYVEPVERTDKKDIMERLKMFLQVYERIAIEFPQGLRFYNKLAGDDAMAEQYFTTFYERNTFFSVAWEILLEFQKTHPEVKVDIINLIQIIDSLVFSGKMLSVMRFQRIRNNVFLGADYDDRDAIIKYQAEALACILKKGGYKLD